MKKTVAILGGDGFIGRNLLKCLMENGDYNVVLFSNYFENNIKHYNGVEYRVGDFFNEDDLEKIVKDSDILVHAICTINPGNSNEKRYFAYTHDLMYTIKLCELCIKYSKRLVFISSGGTVYGNQTELPIKEDASTNPINHYGCLKLCTEHILITYALQQGADIIIARIANVYGPGQQFEKGVGFIDAVIKRAIEGKPVTVFGNGDSVRDYIFVTDACKMLLSLFEYKGNYNVFNLSTGKGASQRQIIEIVRTKYPTLIAQFQPARKVDANDVVLDNSRILGIYPMPITKIAEGISQFIEFQEKKYEEYKDK